MNKYIAFLLSVAFIFACGKAEEKSDGSEFNPDEVKRLENEIKRIHDDELMPQMKNIQLMMSELESRTKDEEANYSAGYEKELIAAQEGLEASYDEMMSWMAEYKPNKYQDKTQMKLYLVEERGKLWKMREGFLENISYAQSTLENPKYE